jgi:hypothetical protein
LSHHIHVFDEQLRLQNIHHPRQAVFFCITRLYESSSIDKTRHTEACYTF